jgi:hypothetical protein
VSSRAGRHLRSDLVFCHQDGGPLTRPAVEAALRYACKRAGLRAIGSHVLRHTFCSHLAMRGAAPKAIQELAGHSMLSMTLRYMHFWRRVACAKQSVCWTLASRWAMTKRLRFEVTRTVQKNLRRGRDSLRCSSPAATALLGTSWADPSDLAARCGNAEECGQTVRTRR